MTARFPDTTLFLAQSYWTSYPFEQGVRAGNISGQTDLAFTYRLGIGVPRSEVESLKWFQRRAGEQAVRAQVMLGNIYSVGEAVK